MRDEVRKKYREVADTPTAEFHFHTGRGHALRMGYPESPLDQLPEEATGVINLCPDKLRVYKEVHRVLRPDGQMTIADICVEKAVPQGALKDIDLWTG